MSAVVALAAAAAIDARALEPEPIARAVSVQGTVEARRASRSAWEAVKLDDAFSAGDTIRVGPRSRAVVALLDRSVLRLAEGTTFTLRPPGPERSGVLDLLRGVIHFLTRGPRSLDVTTELVSVGVRGTEFLVAAEPDATSVTVLEGAVHVENALGSLDLGGGQAAVAQRGQAPVLRVAARPRDAVRWALHYPPVLDVRPATLARDAGVEEQLRRSVAAYRQGDVAGALAALAEVAASPGDAGLLAYRAQLLLGVGRVDEAEGELDRALAAAPRDPRALSLQAIVAVVQNDRDGALRLARAAVEAAPRSATAHVALSYALQARFDLAGARAAVARAVALDADDALAWARLAELRASFGEVGPALEAARRAAALAPGLSRTRTVLGYAHLANVRPAAAAGEFERAIALDSADPLPRLGLGLARVRMGDLDAGARDLEIAATLAPDDALVRSYLGKAYFEERRDGLDERAYETAKALDPLDPTPWFYGAIAKHASNRPVEALWDLDRAIALNDGRGVYRSRLLLDSDLAARSASLARIYADLGFQQLALAEGWRSVQADPASDSAHRLLADSHAALPRHEVARVSELLQAQLLQPLNVTPIQPRLAETNQLLAARGGPGALGFNEFNPIFERDRAAVQLGGFRGDHATVGIEPVVAGVYRNVSVSAGYSSFETGGVGVNHDQTDRLANAFAQAALTSATSVQAEFRLRRLEYGDLQAQFSRDLVRPERRQHAASETYRLGARHAISPGSVVLASAMYQSGTFDFSDRNLNPALLGFDEHQRLESLGGELQHVLRSEWIDVVSGAGFFRTAERDVSLWTFASEPPAPPGTSTESEAADASVRHGNVYAYAHLHLVDALTVTAGASVDLLRDGSSGDRNQLNPKLGVTWSPLDGTTLRASAFRALKRTLIGNQTLEPTHVAGFNQLFDDFQGTRSWRYGVGADQKILPGLAAGVEGSRRDLEVPLEIAARSASGKSRTTWHEYGARGYVYWTPSAWLAARAEYAFERLVREPVSEFMGATLGVRRANTHRVPLGVAVFHRSGLGASTTATFFHQEGSFGETPPFTDGSDRFWLLDATVSWRLPRRAGTVSLVATNLLATHFRLFENGGASTSNSTVQPARAVIARVTLAAP